MAERFGYSLDIGKSLENDENSEQKADSAKEESKEEVVVDQESASVSDNESDEENSEHNSQSNSDNESSENDNNESRENRSKESEATVDSEDFGEPIVDDSDEEVTGEMLSANKVKKDILDEIKEDVEGVSEASGSVRADNDIEDLEDDKEVFNPTSAEAYSEESPAEAVESEHIADKAQEEGVLDSAEEESYVSEQRPLTPEEEDVKDMVDKSFKENTEADAIIEEDKLQTSSLWKWGVGVLILIVLAFVVVKFGFIGPVDNTPSAAIPVDEIPLETDSTDSLVTDVIPVVNEDVQDEPVVPVESEKELITEPVQEPVPEPEPAPIVPVKEKDPEQLLNILKEGLN